MTPLFLKLNYKGQRTIHVLNAPQTFEAEIAALTDTVVRREVTADSAVEFAIAFVSAKRELDAVSALLVKAAIGDATLWIAYPKKTSRKYKCDFNRDTGWEVLGDAGFEGVRQVAIDEDWSALRFRRIDFIKSFTRAAERATSTEGKARARG